MGPWRCGVNDPVLHTQRKAHCILHDLTSSIMQFEWKMLASLWLEIFALWKVLCGERRTPLAPLLLFAAL